MISYCMLGFSIVLTNGWNPDCQLRFECIKPYPITWTVYEKSGSEPSHLLLAEDEGLSVILTKQPGGTKIQRKKSIQPVKDCVLETKSLGDHPIYNLTFTGKTTYKWVKSENHRVRPSAPNDDHHDDDNHHNYDDDYDDHHDAHNDDHHDAHHDDDNRRADDDD
ncbi:hypothetical protein AAVH_36950 [Aphelenchoides avenae]|nr:hypothetical protein AAVH_36950 [Aphelenchus avenae]